MPFLKRLHQYKVQGKTYPGKEMEKGSKRKCLIHISKTGAVGHGWMSKGM
jgi:hypothetical protein